MCLIFVFNDVHNAFIFIKKDFILIFNRRFKFFFYFYSLFKIKYLHIFDINTNLKDIKIFFLNIC